MSKEMLISTVLGKECRIAIVENARMEELYIERASSASHVGNIYKGRVTNVEPSIQAAFVDFGGVKNGFLHISDVHPQFFTKSKRQSEPVGKKRPHRDRPPIQECLRRGQEVIVQITKEGIGTKGPTMTTYLSIPGRLLVMMPGMSRLGVSRKIEDEEARSKARQLFADLKLPQEMGFIIRTAGMDRTKRELQRDLQYLLRLWKSVSRQIKTVKAPSEIYQESDLVIRTLRDIYNTDITRIICDNKAEALKVKEFLDVAVPRGKHSIELYTGPQGLFHDFQLESEIERIFSRRVELKSGGSLVIDQAEALVAIDVNSGRYRAHSDAEMTALKINLEAAGEISRQLRLRDLGGVIIIDFIDMRLEKNRHAVEKTLREAIKNDRAKTKLLRISAFGIVEMTRQRVRASLKDSIFTRCSYCGGSGLVKSDESQSLAVMRTLQRAACHPEVANIELVVTPMVAHHLLNFQRMQIAQIEEESRKSLIIRADPTLAGDELRIQCTSSRGSPVAWDQSPLAGAGKGKPTTVSIDQFAPQPTPGEAEEEGPEEPTIFDVVEGEPEEGPAPEAQEPSTPPPAPQAHPQPPPAAAPESPAAAKATPLPAKHPHPAPSGRPPQPGQAEGEKKRRRRGRRGGRKHRKRSEGPAQTQQGHGGPQVRQPAPAETAPQQEVYPRPSEPERALEKPVATTGEPIKPPMDAPAPRTAPQTPPAAPTTPPGQAPRAAPSAFPVTIIRRKAPPPPHGKPGRRPHKGRGKKKGAPAEGPEEVIQAYEDSAEEGPTGAPLFKPGD